MHVAMVIGGSVLLLAFFVLFGKLWGGDASSMALGAKAFIPVWVVIAAVNMWVGVAKAGYSVREEAPILLIVALVPTLLAICVVWLIQRA